MQITFASDLLRGELTQLRMVAGDQVWIDVFPVLAFPRFEGVQLGQRRRSSNPFDRLIVRYEIDIFIFKQVVDELLENSEVLLLFKPKRQMASWLGSS